ncbi:hypothetical protein GDO81_008811 [Engystomops pustulosus]|uniref:Uncharacterized protein n=1 Tax=Engystomops pustulosus TaxID=76066 RepID=A0AAV7CH58_ENGPU|nr:hypothetical protein GDO81_008811 [Engystomops pustulosus]
MSQMTFLFSNCLKFANIFGAKNSNRQNRNLENGDLRHLWDIFETFVTNVAKRGSLCTHIYAGTPKCICVHPHMCRDTQMHLCAPTYVQGHPNASVCTHICAGHQHTSVCTHVATGTPTYVCVHPHMRRDNPRHALLHAGSDAHI